MLDRPLHVLVTYGSKRGGTEEIASVIAEVLIDEGIDAELAPAAEIHTLEPYDAVIVGGALYANRWHHDARRFVRRNAAALRSRSVWMFSSGPLDHSADEGTIAPTSDVSSLMTFVSARGHITFGGRLTRDSRGFIASAMAKRLAGDYRDWERIRNWGREVARTLDLTPRPTIALDAPAPRAQHLLAALCMFVGITAIGGGAALVARPDGSLLEASQTWLGHAPFHSFLIPGLLLLFVIGVGNAIAAVLVWRDAKSGPVAAVLGGSALLIWIVTEMILLRSHHWLQLGYLLVGGVILREARKAFANRLAAAWHALAH